MPTPDNSVILYDIVKLIQTSSIPKSEDDKLKMFNYLMSLYKEGAVPAKPNIYRDIPVRPEP